MERAARALMTGLGKVYIMVEGHVKMLSSKAVRSFDSVVDIRCMEAVLPSFN